MVCFKLMKWASLGVVGAVGAGYLAFGDHASSYLGAMATSVRETVRGKIPVEFELKRAEQLVAEIEPQIESCKRDVARAEVELVDLDEQIQDLSAFVGKQERKLKAGREVLAADQATASHVPAGRMSDRARVEVDIARTLESHRGNVALLRGKVALRERQTQSVDAARARLDAVRSQKGRLEDQIAALRLQKRELDAANATSLRFDLDDTALSKAKEVLTRVKTELDIAQKMIEGETGREGLNGQAPCASELVKEIDEFFSQADCGGGLKPVPRPSAGR